MNICAFCRKPRKSMEDWHTCQEARDARDRMDKEIQNRIAGLERVAEGKPRRIKK